VKKAVILIDGQNLFYYLKKINLLESHIDWDKFLNSLIDSKEDELVRTL
jgi:hypothetical protein